MSRFVFTADWHIGSHRGPEIDGYNGRLLDIQKQMVAILKYCITNQIKTLIVGGDLYREKDPSNMHRQILAQIIKSAQENDIEMLMIPGNHDCYRARGQTHTLAEFVPFIGPRLNIFDKITVYPVEDVEFTFFPYSTAPQADKVPQCEKSKYPQVLVMHGTIEGGFANRMVDYEVFDEDIIPYDRVKGYDLILAGHLHCQQNFKNVWYPGSIERLDFGDMNTDKCFLDVTVNGPKSIDVKKVPLDAREMMEMNAAQLSLLKADRFSVKNAIVRVIGVERDKARDVRRLLAEKGCYYISSMQYADGGVDDVAKSGTVDIGKFIEIYAKKSNYKGDLKMATKAVFESLENQT